MVYFNITKIMVCDFVCRKIAVTQQTKRLGLCQYGKQKSYILMYKKIMICDFVGRNIMVEQQTLDLIYCSYEKRHYLFALTKYINS